MIFAIIEKLLYNICRQTILSERGNMNMLVMMSTINHTYNRSAAKQDRWSECFACVVATNFSEDDVA